MDQRFYFPSYYLGLRMETPLDEFAHVRARRLASGGSAPSPQPRDAPRFLARAPLQQVGNAPKQPRRGSSLFTRWPRSLAGQLSDQRCLDCHTSGSTDSRSSNGFPHPARPSLLRRGLAQVAISRHQGPGLFDLVDWGKGRPRLCCSRRTTPRSIPGFSRPCSQARAPLKWPTSFHPRNPALDHPSRASRQLLPQETKPPGRKTYLKWPLQVLARAIFDEQPRATAADGLAKDCQLRERALEARAGGATTTPAPDFPAGGNARAGVNCVFLPTPREREILTSAGGRPSLPCPVSEVFLRALPKPSPPPGGAHCALPANLPTSDPSTRRKPFVQVCQSCHTVEGWLGAEGGAAVPERPSPRRPG